MQLDLKLDFQFADLYDVAKLKELDSHFLSYLKQQDNELYKNLLEYRQEFNQWELRHSKLIIEVAPYLEEFIANLFSIKDELHEAKAQYTPLAKIYECKRSFVQRHALKSKSQPTEDIASILTRLASFISSTITEYNIEQFEQIFAEYALIWLKQQDQEKLEIASAYAVWACMHPVGIKKHNKGTLFKFPHKLDFENLLSLEAIEADGIRCLRTKEIHQRHGFELTDKGCELNFAIDQSNYCIHCHNQQKDSCSKGIKDGQNGCPLDEKISEMNLLKSKSNIIATLAVAIIDNPMLAATGHRICNDCMKACIYQKQQPVDIPQIETRVLKDVLELPWGFEIYSLLTRWNPLSFKQFYPKEDTGSKVLVVGMGPAGFTLAHYLLNQGHIVVGIDGLKIEDISAELLNAPIKDINQFFESLDQRLVAGFGGVMEYGITNRWNKNFLLLIRLLLQRRANFKLFSGVRLGSNIIPQQAFDMGFQHIALALGSGSPKLLSLPNIVAKGVRTASDFLMSLQLGKAYQKDSLTNLQIRMPVIVIGGGLTALDAATEALAYYPELVKKFRANYKPTNFTEEEQQIADEFLNYQPDANNVKIIYRQKIQNAPSYRLNHEELALGLSEGIDFLEEVTPTKIILDQYGHVKSLEAKQIVNGEARSIALPARTILIAAGTVPNVIIEQEFPEYFTKDGKYLKIIEDEFIVYNNGKNSISCFGDMHPKYAGNVVKAMASAKHGYKEISKLLKKDVINREQFFAELTTQLVPTLVKINRLTSNIVELVIKSPLSAKNFLPGQFFRLQNYANLLRSPACAADGSLPGMTRNNKLPLVEGLALTGAKVENDLISLIILEMGGSSNLCAELELNKPLVLMGPTGSPTEIHANETVMLVGGGLGNAVLFSIGQAFRQKQSKVIYFAGYRKLEDRYKIEEIEAAADQIIWSCDEGLLSTSREQDSSFKGNIIESILDFAVHNPEVLQSIDRVIVIGSDKMMHALKQARHGVLKPYLKPEHIAIASVNSPMQCMMKEICGQCLQKHIDPVTGVESYVFSCTHQDQEMDRVDFYHLADRLAQNHLLEKIST